MRLPETSPRAHTTTASGPAGFNAYNTTYDVFHNATAKLAEDWRLSHLPVTRPEGRRGAREAVIPNVTELTATVSS